MQLLIWLTETRLVTWTKSGSLSLSALSAELVHDGKLSKKSLFATEDFWKRGQEKAKTSRVLLTNHAYLVTRLEDNQSLSTTVW